MDISDKRKLQIGQETLVKVKNNTGSLIPNGSVVYPSGSTGDLVEVSLAKSDNYYTSRPVGVATEDIGRNQTGYVTTFGAVRNLDTSGFTEGAAVYVSPTNAGEITETKPTYPNLAVRIGTVVRANNESGKIIVDSDPETNIYQTGSVLFANGDGEIAEDNDGITFNSSTNVLTVGSGTSTNWDTAYSWGNHADVGYLTDINGESIDDLSDVDTTTSAPTADEVLS